MFCQSFPGSNSEPFKLESPFATVLGPRTQLSFQINVITLSLFQVTIPLLPDEKIIQPVGFDYIEEVKNEEGKVISFRCKLCECKFNDPNAKEMHMKGRRHRLQYKKKVNPDLVVDLKPSLRQRKLAEERAKRSMAKEDFWRRREEEFRMMSEADPAASGGPGGPHGDHEKGMWGPPWRHGGPHGGGGPPGGMHPPMMMRRPDSSDDRHVIAKHGQIYPTDEQLAAIQKQVKASLESETIFQRGAKGLELRQYKSDSIQSKKLPALILPRFFTQLHGERKSAVISKLATFLTELSRSCNVLALV